MLPLHFQSATRLAAEVRRGAISARALLEHFFARVEALNPRVNAIVRQDRLNARQQADAADAAQARGESWGPLHGVPVTVKESFDMTGLPTTFGEAARVSHRAGSDALAVRRLRDAGAIVFGKTNVPLALADFQSYNEAYGTTGNPWNTALTPGGSSGGSAAALAAGLTGLELGSDIGGSIRNPAHFCGVFGHKPTYDLVAPRGHTLDGVLTMPDIAVAGPLARSAADLALSLPLIAQPDELEAAGRRYRLRGLDKPTASLRIAVWADDPASPVSNAVRERLGAVQQALRAAGATVDTSARPDFDAAQAHRLYNDLLQAALSSGLSDAQASAALAREAGLSPQDDSLSARNLRAQLMRRRDWARLNERRTQLRWQWHRFFEQWDFLIAPIMPVTAFAHDHQRFGARRLMVDGESRPYFEVLFWAGLASAAYLPATVLPAGLAADGLPVGVQIIGPAYGDLRTIGLAQRLEAMGFGFIAPPAMH